MVTSLQRRGTLLRCAVRRHVVGMGELWQWPTGAWRCSVPLLSRAGGDTYDMERVRRRQHTLPRRQNRRHAVGLGERRKRQAWPWGCRPTLLAGTKRDTGYGGYNL